MINPPRREKIFIERLRFRKAAALPFVTNLQPSVHTPVKTILLASLASLALATAAHAASAAKSSTSSAKSSSSGSSAKASSSSSASSARATSPRPQATAKSVASPTKTPAQQREFIKETVRVTAPRNPTVTSEYRSNSPAHRRGAIDISSKNLTPAQRRAEAQAISSRLGRGYNVVVEEVHQVQRGQFGPSGQVNTTFNNGRQGTVRVGDVRASATPTHIQPNR
jgi:hypothetical protein